MNNTQKTRYSDAELAEFKNLILGKIEVAKDDLAFAISSLESTNSTDEMRNVTDGAMTAEKESLTTEIARQKKFIDQLEAALVRIENKTYGICREKGILIPVERLRAVPHTTLSIGAKQLMSA